MDDNPSGNGQKYLAWRLDNQEQRIVNLEAKNVDVLSERMTHMGEEFRKVCDDVEALRSVLIKFAFSIAVSAIIFAITIFSAVK